MRPRKRIAVIDAVEISRIVRSFVADVWGYHVIPVATARQAALLVRRERIDVILAVLPVKGDWRSLKRAALINPQLRVMSLDPRAGYGASYAQLSLDVKSSPWMIRESLKILATRKRGPKKQPEGVNRTLVNRIEDFSCAAGNS